MDNLTDWANKLATKIADLSADYDVFRSAAEGRSSDPDALEVDPIESRAWATMIARNLLQEIILELDKLPVLHGAFRNGPMIDLIAALDDLRRGKRSDFFVLLPGQNLPSTKFIMLKLRAVASVHTAMRSGMNDADARALVAKIFTDAGHTGKKKGPISKSTVFDWCTEMTPNLNGTTEQRILAETLAKLPAVIPAEKVKNLIRKEAAKRL